MAGVYVTPGIDDPYNRFVGVIFRIITELLGPRTVPERPEVLDSVPSMATKFLWSFPVYVDLLLLSCTGTLVFLRYLTLPTGFPKLGQSGSWRDEVRIGGNVENDYSFRVGRLL